MSAYAPCQEYAATLKAEGARVETTVYPGAKHGFDGGTAYKVPQGENYSRCVFVQQPDGNWKERTSGVITNDASGKRIEAAYKQALAKCRTLGVSGGPNEAAKTKAMADLKSYVQRHLLEKNRDKLVEVNGRSYRVPERPTVVVCFDGCDPDYIRHGLAVCRLVSRARAMNSACSIRAHAVQGIARWNAVPPGWQANQTFSPVTVVTVAEMIQPLSTASRHRALVQVMFRHSSVLDSLQASRVPLPGVLT